ncbi:STM3941 family protein [Bradyrhizobium sp. SZCCHNRI3043]|uniref:STM3941 family protein n=1 Tax=Bradyrhizobium sp. SZCCHNRI3043 TaxID=3057292 RepID=UPI0028E451A3|nr:STM3941 family protein [Bradyrhizobium sp. SZCCHNRI3043]
MQGSLDRPPVVIHSSRSKSLLGLLACIALLAAALFMVQDPEANHLIGYAGIGFFSLGIPFVGWSIFRPDRLVLTPDGVTQHALFRSGLLKWKDVHAFRPYSPTPGSREQLIGYDVVGNSNKEGRFVKVARSLAGADGTLGGGWEMQPAALADLLNRARAHWLQQGD